MFGEFLSLYGDRTVGTKPNEEAMGVLHKLKGSSGSIGFSAINQSATEFEAGLKEWPSEQDGVYEARQLEVLTGLARLINGVKPDDSKLYNQTLHGASS